jgi:UDP-N-acetyl-D-galactosamine dehydrogenase
VADIITELRDYDLKVDVYDPRVVPEEVEEEIGLTMVPDPFAAETRYDAIVVAVPHDEFRGRPVADFVRLLRADNGGGVLIDVRGMLDRAAVTSRGIAYWCL